MTVASQQIPRSLVAPLVSILLHESEPPENLTWSSMATLSELGKEASMYCVRFEDAFVFVYVCMLTVTRMCVYMHTLTLSRKSSGSLTAVIHCTSVYMCL